MIEANSGGWYILDLCWHLNDGSSAPNGIGALPTVSCLCNSWLFTEANRATH